MTALLTFLLGSIALAFWFFLMGVSRSACLLIATGLFYSLAASITATIIDVFFGLIVGLDSEQWYFVSGILLYPFVEETAKFLAARRRQASNDIFPLICLFGIFELMLIKPQAMLGEQDWAVALFALPALAMHVLTAAIYAYAWSGNRISQLLICALLHAIFNALTDLSDFTPMPWLVMAGAFVAISVSIIVISPWAKWPANWRG